MINGGGGEMVRDILLLYKKSCTAQILGIAHVVHVFSRQDF